MKIIGSHISAEGQKGIQQAIIHASTIDANCLQIFVSNRVGKGTKKLTDDDAIEIKKLLKSKKISLFIHSPYVLNFAKEFEPNSWWIKLYLKELEICHSIGAIGCVIHMGKFLQLNTDYANDLWLASIKYLAKEVLENKWSSQIILETPAGQGTEMYTTIELFSIMYNSFSDKEKKVIKICIDTCHIFASGYEIEEYFKKFKDLIGYQDICLIHLNDSKKPRGSCVDRHENIGLGNISSAAINFVVNLADKENIPIILETPDISKHPAEIKYINGVHQ